MLRQKQIKVAEVLEVSPLYETTTNIVFFTVLVSIEKLSHFLTKVKKKSRNWWMD